MSIATDLPSTDQFLTSSVMRRIHCSVKRLRRKFGLQPADGHDLVQDFCLDILRARRNFDGGKCTPDRFVAMVINGRYKHHVRLLMRHRRGAGKTIHARGFDDIGQENGRLIVDPAAECPHDRVALREELASLTCELSTLEQQVCELLAGGHTPFSASVELGIAPSTVTRAMTRIAKHFSESGFFQDFEKATQKKRAAGKKTKVEG